jgi:hypothetical protein
MDKRRVLGVEAMEVERALMKDSVVLPYKFQPDDVKVGSSNRRLTPRIVVDVVIGTANTLSAQSPISTSRGRIDIIVVDSTKGKARSAPSSTPSSLNIHAVTHLGSNFFHDHLLFQILGFK